MDHWWPVWHAAQLHTTPHHNYNKCAALAIIMGPDLLLLLLCVSQYVDSENI